MIWMRLVVLTQLIGNFDFTRGYIVTDEMNAIGGIDAIYTKIFDFSDRYMPFPYDSWDLSWGLDEYDWWDWCYLSENLILPL